VLPVSKFLQQGKTDSHFLSSVFFFDFMSCCIKYNIYCMHFTLLYFCFEINSARRTEFFILLYSVNCDTNIYVIDWFINTIFEHGNSLILWFYGYFFKRCYICIITLYTYINSDHFTEYIQSISVPICDYWIF
jgi:hypothetical protein